MFKKVIFTFLEPSFQKIMTINPRNLETENIDISYLSNGIYYIKTNLPVKPLKFLKTS